VKGFFRGSDFRSPTKIEFCVSFFPFRFRFLLEMTRSAGWRFQVRRNVREIAGGPTENIVCFWFPPYSSYDTMRVFSAGVGSLIGSEAALKALHDLAIGKGRIPANRQDRMAIVSQSLDCHACSHVHQESYGSALTIHTLNNILFDCLCVSRGPCKTHSHSWKAIIQK
jgi:hypothetical protein